MIDKINNTKGYALIVVLLIIVVIAVMTPPIISKIMSNSSQFKIVEENLQIEKLGDMGLIYMDNSIDHSEEEAQEQAEILAEEAAKRAVAEFLSKYDVNDVLSYPSQNEIDDVHKAAYKKEYLEVFKREFNEKMLELLNPILPSCNEDGVESFSCMEVEAKDVFYKYKIAWRIRDDINDENILLIDYKVYMTVINDYNNSLPMKNRTITIKFS